MTNRKNLLLIFSLIAFEILMWVIFIYHLNINANFISDDFYVWQLLRTLTPIDSLRLFLPKILGGLNHTNFTEHFIPLTVWLMWIITIPLKMSHQAAHMISLSLHLSNALLAGIFNFKLTHKYKSAYLSALIFGTFPFITETVNYVTANLFLLGTVFYILALLFIIEFINTRQNKWKIFHIISFGFGLLSAEISITIPLAVLLIFILLEKQSFRDSIRIYRSLFITYALIIGIYITLRTLSLESYNLLVSTGHFEKWMMSRMFVVYIIVMVVLIIIRNICKMWIPKEILKNERSLWLLLFLTGISWLSTAKLLTQERYLYLPAVFASIFVAEFFYILYRKFQMPIVVRKILSGFLFTVIAFNSIFVYKSSLKWLNAATIARSIVIQLSQILKSHPIIDSPFYLINIPDSIDGAIVHRSYFLDAIEFYSGKKPEPFIFTPLTYGINTTVIKTGKKSARLVSRNGFLLFMPTLTQDGRRMIEWPGKYRAVQRDFYTLEVDFLDNSFSWDKSIIYAYENGTIQIPK